MTEYEILYLMSEVFDRIWALIQFWSSVSFGYLVLAHVAARRLNVMIVLVLSLLYIAFSAQMLELLITHSRYVSGYQQELQELSETVGLDSQAAVHANEYSPQYWGATVSLFGTFLAALMYLPYCYYTSRNANTSTSGIA